MKKFLALILAITVCACFAGCTAPKTNEGGVADDIAGTEASDWAYIADKGEMIIGITYFNPMNFVDATGSLTGFETEFAEAVCEKLGVTPVFQEIDWNSKETELNAKNIDCIWNGMTVTAERQANMDITNEYMQNKQVMIAKKDGSEKFAAQDGIAGAIVVAEKGSVGEEVAQAEEFFAEASYTAVDAQSKALLEVKSGTADVAIVDYVLSIGTIGEGTDYSDLAVVEGQDFAPDNYGIAFRKGSAETLAKVNAIIAELIEDGTLDTIAEKYNLESLLIK